MVSKDSYSYGIIAGGAALIGGTAGGAAGNKIFSKILNNSYNKATFTEASNIFHDVQTFFNKASEVHANKNAAVASKIFKYGGIALGAYAGYKFFEKLWDSNNDRGIIV